MASPPCPFQYTGPMLHLVNGKPVEGIEATLSSTIHVHAVCIEWYAIIPFFYHRCLGDKDDLMSSETVKEFPFCYLSCHKFNTESNM